jgi:hypothetical protein
MSPYCRPAPPDATPEATEIEDCCPDRDLLPMMLVFWLGSVARVAAGVAHHERFGTEGTLALLAILVVPYVFRNSILWSVRRCCCQRRAR